LQKIRKYGEAHYFVAQGGEVYRIIDKAKIATHAGRSMWKGQPNLDHQSIGIEVVGYHDQDITRAQYAALRELIRQLKALYRIADDHVLTHSMVAYGRPNRFHPNNHRGRKRCGMIFADPDVRRKLGLNSRPERDVDVENGRLKVADAELYRFMFTRARAPQVASTAPAPAAVTEAAFPTESNLIGEGTSAWKIAREQYNDPKTLYVFPNGQHYRGDEIKDWGNLPPGTRVEVFPEENVQGFEGFLEVGKDGKDARDLAGEEYQKATTIYFFPSGLIRTGSDLKRRASTQPLLESPPAGTRILVGYVYGGHVRTRRPALTIAGAKWNYPSTFYRFPNGTIVSGDEIDDSAIPADTLVFYRN